MVDEKEPVVNVRIVPEGEEETVTEEFDAAEAARRAGRETPPVPEEVPVPAPVDEPEEEVADSADEEEREEISPIDEEVRDEGRDGDGTPPVEEEELEEEADVDSEEEELEDEASPTDEEEREDEAPTDEETLEEERDGDDTPPTDEEEHEENEAEQTQEAEQEAAAPARAPESIMTDEVFRGEKGEFDGGEWIDEIFKPMEQAVKDGKTMDEVLFNLMMASLESMTRAIINPLEQLDRDRKARDKAGRENREKFFRDMLEKRPELPRMIMNDFLAWGMGGEFFTTFDEQQKKTLTPEERKQLEAFNLIKSLPKKDGKIDWDRMEGDDRKKFMKQMRRYVLKNRSMQVKLTRAMNMVMTKEEVNKLFGLSSQQRSDAKLESVTPRSDERDDETPPAPVEHEDERDEETPPAPVEHEDERDEETPPAPVEHEDERDEEAPPAPVEHEDERDDETPPAPVEHEDERGDETPPAPVEREEGRSDETPPAPIEHEEVVVEDEVHRLDDPMPAPDLTEDSRSFSEKLSSWFVRHKDNAANVLAVVRARGRGKSRTTDPRGRSGGRES